MEPVTSGIVIELEHVAVLALVNFVITLLGLVRVRAEAFKNMLEVRKRAEQAAEVATNAYTSIRSLTEVHDADPK